MKKLYVIIIFFLAAFGYGQEKYALVIGNSNYANFGTLKNPASDAADMKDVLENLGFTVDILLDGSLSQMENSTIRLRNRLSEAGNDSIGFFYYAGHGLEMNGVNYLIPSDANISDRVYLRERAFSTQIMLDMLNESRNALNIVVLDACRDFPAAWSRSLNRGLAITANPPANHIIMYATGAGSVAVDGSGRNGLFTGRLLYNLKQPGIDVNEVFRRTMVDVANESNNLQRPALYTDFGKTVYIGPPPLIAQPEQGHIAQEQPEAQVESAKINIPSIEPDNYRINRDRRKKWVYFGPYLGYMNLREHENLDRYTTNLNTALGNDGVFGFQLDLIPLDLVLSDFFAIELAARLNLISFFGLAFDKPQMPILGSLGLRYKRIGISFNAGYSVGFNQIGFTLGATFGVQLYPGILFVDFLSMPSPTTPTYSYIKADSAMFIVMGYKFGIGFYKERKYNRNK